MGRKGYTSNHISVYYEKTITISLSKEVNSVGSGTMATNREEQGVQERTRATNLKLQFPHLNISTLTTAAYPPSISDSKLTCLQNPFSDWTSSTCL